MRFSVPSLARIQRTNLVVIAIFGLILLTFRSAPASLACLLGGGVVVANLFLLGLLGRVLLSAAAGGAGSALGAIAIPFKLLLIVLLLYLVFTQSKIDPVGFSLGVFSQLVAVVIESLRGSTEQVSETMEGSSV